MDSIDKKFKNIICYSLIVAFVGSSLYVPQAQAGEMVMPLMPKPGTMVNLSPDYTPAHLQGITVHSDNALQFDFLINKGEGDLDLAQKKIEYKKLVKYFLASLTIPDDNQWVNLSPYEKDHIIESDFGKTEMGRDLLTQDYLLKQITSSLMYPESGLGKKFWDRVYRKAEQEYGQTNIPVNTFNKVWITPDEAIVYESGNSAYIVKSHLKVMLEEDYLSLAKHSAISTQTTNTTHTLASKIVKEIILPELEKEVNEGKNFAMLRQIYSGMVLATWYKRALKESLLGKIYANKAKVIGVNVQDPNADRVIYQDYLKAFKKGVFNYIKEDVDTYSQQSIPRKYFAGGWGPNPKAVIEESVSPAMLAATETEASPDLDNAKVDFNLIDATDNPIIMQVQQMIARFGLGDAVSVEHLGDQLYFVAKVSNPSEALVKVQSAIDSEPNLKGRVKVELGETSGTIVCKVDLAMFSFGKKGQNSQKDWLYGGLISILVFYVMLFAAVEGVESWQNYRDEKVIYSQMDIQEIFGTRFGHNWSWLVNGRVDKPEDLVKRAVSFVKEGRLKESDVLNFGQDLVNDVGLSGSNIQALNKGLQNVLVDPENSVRTRVITYDLMLSMAFAAENSLMKGPNNFPSWASSGSNTENHFLPLFPDKYHQTQEDRQVTGYIKWSNEGSADPNVTAKWKALTADELGMIPEDDRLIQIKKLVLAGDDDSLTQAGRILEAMRFNSTDPAPKSVLEEAEQSYWGGRLTELKKYVAMGDTNSLVEARMIFNTMRFNSIDPPPQNVLEAARKVFKENYIDPAMTVEGINKIKALTISVIKVAPDTTAVESIYSQWFEFMRSAYQDGDDSIKTAVLSAHDEVMEAARAKGLIISDGAMKSEKLENDSNFEKLARNTIIKGNAAMITLPEAIDPEVKESLVKFLQFALKNPESGLRAYSFENGHLNLGFNQDLNSAMISIQRMLGIGSLSLGFGSYEFLKPMYDYFIQNHNTTNSIDYYLLFGTMMAVPVVFSLVGVLFILTDDSQTNIAIAHYKSVLEAMKSEEKLTRQKERMVDQLISSLKRQFTQYSIIKTKTGASIIISIPKITGEDRVNAQSLAQEALPSEDFSVHFTRVFRGGLEIRIESTNAAMVVTSYTVQEGDTLSGISKRFGTNVNRLVKDNKLSSSRVALQAGQALSVRTNGWPPGITYVVQPGDTWESISAKTGISVQKLERDNFGLVEDRNDKTLVPGDKIKTNYPYEYIEPKIGAAGISALAIAGFVVLLIFVQFGESFYDAHIEKKKRAYVETMLGTPGRIEADDTLVPRLVDYIIGLPDSDKSINHTSDTKMLVPMEEFLVKANLYADDGKLMSKLEATLFDTNAPIKARREAFRVISQHDLPENLVGFRFGKLIYARDFSKGIGDVLGQLNLNIFIPDDPLGKDPEFLDLYLDEAGSLLPDNEGFNFDVPPDIVDDISGTLTKLNDTLPSDDPHLMRIKGLRRLIQEATPSSLFNPNDSTMNGSKNALSDEAWNGELDSLKGDVDNNLFGAAEETLDTMTNHQGELPAGVLDQAKQYYLAGLYRASQEYTKKRDVANAKKYLDLAEEFKKEQMSVPQNKNHHNPAMMAGKVASANPITHKQDTWVQGGIDLNSANMAMIIKRDGRGVPLPLVQQDMAQLSHIQGFDADILEIQPVTSTLILNQLQQKPQTSSLTGI